MRFSWNYYHFLSKLWYPSVMCIYMYTELKMVSYSTSLGSIQPRCNYYAKSTHPRANRCLWSGSYLHTRVTWGVVERLKLSNVRNVSEGIRTRLHWLRVAFYCWTTTLHVWCLHTVVMLVSAVWWFILLTNMIDNDIFVTLWWNR